MRRGQVTWLTCAPEELAVSIPSQSVPGWLHGLWFSPWVGELHLEQDPSHLLSLVVSPAVQPHSRTSVDMAKK